MDYPNCHYDSQMQESTIMEDGSEISRLAPELSDLEVALFLCLAAHQHCRIDTTDANIHDVAKELALVTQDPVILSTRLLIPHWSRYAQIHLVSLIASWTALARHL